MIRFAWVWRVSLCVLLIAGGLSSTEVRGDRPASLEQLYADVRTGRADRLEYRYEVNGTSYDLRVRWSTNPFTSYEHFETGHVGPVPRELLEAFPEDYDGPRGDTFQEDLAKANPYGHTRVGSYDDEPSATFWVRNLPPGPWSVSFTALALALYILMLGTSDHRFANRWAWFWMFLTSPLGMVGYLLLERRPLPPLPLKHDPIGGFRGFFFALALSFLFGLLALPLRLLQA